MSAPAAAGALIVVPAHALGLVPGDAAADGVAAARSAYPRGGHQPMIIDDHSAPSGRRQWSRRMPSTTKPRDT